jgi:hypothetical protein
MQPTEIGLSPHDIERVNRIEEQFLATTYPGDISEVRGWFDPSTGREGTAAGLFRDMRKAALAAIMMTNRGLQTYRTLNPIRRDSEYAKHQRINWINWRALFAAADRHIACRRLYLLDFDPDRPGFKKDCATEAEKAAASEQAQDCMRYLASLGWPEPIVNDSGNGFHLLYSEFGTEVDRDSTEYLVAALQYLKGKFPYLDTTVTNPARVARVPHTVNRKGVNTEERPHRYTRVVSYPEGSLKTVGPSRIQQLAMMSQKTDEDGKRLAKPRQDSTSELLIDEEGVENLIDEFPDQLALAGIGYKGDATWFALSWCPFKGGEHHDQNVGMGHTCIILWPDNIGFKCFCGDHSFTDLLKLLHSETGRWPKTPIWHDDLEKLEARWGCPIEDLSPRSTKPDTSHYDEERTRTEFSFHARLEDKRISEQQTPDELRSFRERMNAIWAAMDYEAMLKWLETIPDAYCGEPA